MSKLTIWEKVKETIGSISWKLFIWANDTTEDKYWHAIWKQEEIEQIKKKI